MSRTLIIVMSITMSLLTACTDETFKDVSRNQKYSNVVGAEYEIVGPLIAYGIRDHLDAPVELVTLIPPPGIEGSEIGFRVPIEIGSRVIVRRVLKTNRVFDAPITLVVELKGTRLPIDSVVRIDLFRGNEGEGNIDLNSNIYRRVHPQQ
jgi:hypothetical protein